MQEPLFPLPPGGHLPDLHLAGSGLNVASGMSVQPMPDPGKPDPYTPVLHGSPERGGIDPAAPVPVLNLAGVEGVPTPDELVRPLPETLNTPDFGFPDFSEPPLQMFDLTEPAINYAYGDEFAPDPLIPDLTSYRRPYGLDVRDTSLWAADPPLTDLLAYELPNGITVHHDPTEPDPTLPDLQHPTLTQAVHMQGRPADLADSALDVLHGTASYQQVDKDYPTSRLDQTGMNTTRARHLSLLDYGLDGVG